MISLDNAATSWPKPEAVLPATETEIAAALDTLRELAGRPKGGMS